VALRVTIDPAQPPTGPFPALDALLRDLITALRDRNAYHRLFHWPGEAAGGFTIAANFRGWLETLAALREAHPLHWRLLGQALHQSHPNLFDMPSAPGEPPPYRVVTLGEEDQLQLLKSQPLSDLPVFVFKLICDRGITHEVVRHRVFSFTQESTRYVNYQDRGMTLMVPEELEPFFDPQRGAFTERNPLVEEWLTRGESIFRWYQEDLARGLKAEIARDILPNLLKSEIFVSGRWSGWSHFIALRDSPKAHPRIRALAREVRRYFSGIGLNVAS
jgi:flavin-dependent thymidylate synthase